jgi:uncharacterized protein
MLRVSKYNHFQPWENGYIIAYNARSGAVGLMTNDNYAMYLKIAEKLAADGDSGMTPEEQTLLNQLSYGSFVYSEDIEEIDGLRFQHNLARYDTSELGLTIAPTMACNMACAYCYENNKKGRMSSAVVESIIDFVEKRAKRLKKLEISWYGGEPLLALDIIDDLTASFLDLSNEYKFEYAASMISNGYLLNNENVDRLRDLKVGGIQITLDGPARIHNQKRPLKNGKPSFEVIIENLKYASTRIGIGIRVNIDKSFAKEIISELLDELDKAGLRQKVGVYFGLLEPATTACANISENCYENSEFSQVETDYYKILLEKGFRIDKLPSPTVTFCMAQNISSFLIDPDGELYRCFNYAGDKSKSMGNIRDEINYRHSNFMHLFRFEPFSDDACVSCSLLPVCGGGCPSRRADRGLEKEKLCDSWKHNLRPMLEIIARSRQQQAPAAKKE